MIIDTRAPMQAGNAEAEASGWLTIDLAALRRNYARIVATVAPARAAAVVKADAYGLGVRQVSQALAAQGCRDFFVAEFIEALDLKPHLPGDARLFVLNGLQPGNETLCAQAGIIPVANALEQLFRWRDAALALGRTLPVVLQIDTGMSRLGIQPDEHADARALLNETSPLDLLFVMSHLASADDGESIQNGEQRAEMERICAEFPGAGICLANSGGVFLGKAYHNALVRPGIALYGGVPTTGLEQPMEPVVHLDVAVVQTRTVPAGARIGYSGSYVAARPMQLATVAAGYADGLLRSLSDRGAFYFEGIRLPIIGRVSMDSTIVDISALPEHALRLGSRVEVLGPHQTIDALAHDAGTISYEILTRLGTRYRRCYR